MISFSSNARAAEVGLTKIDAVLALDVSTSMNESDVNKVGNEAMKMFIDLAAIEGDRIGVVAYTDQIIREKALIKLNGPQSKEELKSFIDQLARGPYTDVAVGVSEALKILESNGFEKGRVPMIVLFTDGNNSLGQGSTQQQSDDVLNQALTRAQEKGVPIYTIGLNADGNLNYNALKRISDQTGGKSFATSSADDLPRILSEIYASHLKLKVAPLPSLVASGDYQDVKVSIPNASVIEANISMVSSGAVEVKVFDPPGREQSLSGSPNLVFSSSKSYSLLKLIKPAQGEWLLKVKGVNQKQIDINLVYNYDLQLQMNSLSSSNFKPGDTVNVKAQLMANNQPVSDASLFQNLKATLVAKDLDTKQVQEFPMKGSVQGIEGSFQVKEAHEYELQTKVEDANFLRESEVVKISAKPAAAILTATPTTAPAATPVPSPVQPLAQTNDSGTPWLLYLIIAAGILLTALLALLGLRFWKKANRGFVGQIVLEIKDEDTGDRTSPQYKRLGTFQGRFQLHQLLNLQPEYAETKDMVFRPGNGDTLLMKNQSQCVVEKGGRVVDAANGLEIRINDRVRVLLKQSNKSISLEYLR
ncbi:VWA domain-containing protein [Paenibacillus koleovorans]|uniref:VWA domain-containing protein n=1 Tax=Paenibacillus koleovorans TaxID=121608 RepID=UPI000FD93D0B|nr:VWA domain-containing protein [Paenibacillus koleovorans]